MKPSIQALLERDFDEYARTHRLPRFVHQAARSIRRCRTAALGGHVLGCSAGHIAGVWYNSCRHRACPQCAKLQIDRWLEGWRERLLPCDHYHVVFTIPHELLDLWCLNRKRLTNHLFSAARETLFSLLADARFLGAEPGVIAALHTWGRTLSLHPHVHCLVTGGGRDAAGAWRMARGGFLLPVRVVRVVFRSRLMALIRRDLEGGRLALPENLSETVLSNLQRRLYAKTWNVRIQERYEHGLGVVEYLARYVRGGPIRDRRLTATERDSVTFRYRDHRDGRSKLIALPKDEFLRRLIWHIPEPRSHTVRLYGLYSRGRTSEREECRLAMPDVQPRRRSRDTESVRERPCPECGLPLLLLRPLSSTDLPSPPPLPNRLKTP